MKKSKPSNRTSPQKRMARNTTRYVVDYIDHAPVWQGPIFAKGVFRPTQNGAPARPLEVHWTSKLYQNTLQYVLRSPQALNVTDQAVYFHLCQLVAAGKYVALPIEHPRYSAYQEAIAAVGLGEAERMGVVRVTALDLAAGIGLTRTGTNAKSVIEALSRLSHATIERKLLGNEKVEQQGASRFLAFMVADRQLRIVMHFESFERAANRSGVAWINMREHRSLCSKPAKRLHAWLSAWASPVRRKLVGFDSLLANVWGDNPATPSIRKDRLRTLRKAIQEVGKLAGWCCVITEDRRQLLVLKPLFSGTTAQQVEFQPIATTARQLAAATPTGAVATPTDSIGTPTELAETPTSNPLKAALSLGSEELVFAL